MDPFDLKNNNLKVDAFLCKFSYLMTYYKIFDQEHIHNKLKEIDTILK